MIIYHSFSSFSAVLHRTLSSSQRNFEIFISFRRSKALKSSSSSYWKSSTALNRSHCLLIYGFLISESLFLHVSACTIEETLYLILFTNSPRFLLPASMKSLSLRSNNLISTLGSTCILQLIPRPRKHRDRDHHDRPILARLRPLRPLHPRHPPYPPVPPRHHRRSPLRHRPSQFYTDSHTCQQRLGLCRSRGRALDPNLCCALLFDD